MITLPHQSNLPEPQRFGQRMVDQFNSDEAAWRQKREILLAILRRLPPSP